MLRRVTYRAALTALFFTGCWFVFGFLFLMTPVPDALGIGSELIQGWVALFLIALGLSGAMLTLAAINGIFPPVVRAPAASRARPSRERDASWTGGTTARVPRSRER